jgi:hypothetical protein
MTVEVAFDVVVARGVTVLEHELVRVHSGRLCVTVTVELRCACERTR